MEKVHRQSRLECLTLTNLPALVFHLIVGQEATQEYLLSSDPSILGPWPHIQIIGQARKAA